MSHSSEAVQTGLERVTDADSSDTHVCFICPYIYGYLKPGGNGEHEDHTRVETFKEKPDPGAAARYVHHGYLWNAGIFAWTPTALLESVRATALAPLVEALDRGRSGEAFAAVSPVSIDRAVLEPAASEGIVSVVPAAFEWDDLGAWDAMERVYDNDENGNTVLGEALVRDATGTIVASDDDTDVSVLGTTDLVVAAYGNRVLIVPKHDAQRVRELVTELREQGQF
jgi:mannose-1-phosphate guanylyltransferase